MKPSGLMKVGEFCETYSVGRTTLYRLAAAGKIRLRKMGSATRIAREDAEAWVESLPVVEEDKDEAA